MRLTQIIDFIKTEYIKIIEKVHLHLDLSYPVIEFTLDLLLWGYVFYVFKPIDEYFIVQKLEKNRDTRK